MLKKLAVTGGIASGKTAVCKIFEELGATVVYTDLIVHELLKTDGELSKKIIDEFGPEIVKGGAIERKALASIAFKEPSKLKKLEQLIHPAVLEKIDEKFVSATGNCFVVEIPLLYEIGAEDFYDAIIVVIADETTAKKRFMKAGFDQSEYDLRMKRQLNPKEKATRAHYTIENNGTLDDLRTKVVHLATRLLGFQI